MTLMRAINAGYGGVNRIGQLRYVRPAEASTPSLPGDIADLAASSVAYNQVQLSFTNATAASSYQVRVDVGSWEALPGNRIVTGLSPNTEYDFEVRGVNVTGNGNASNTATATTWLPVPGTITNLDAEAINDESVQLAFTDATAASSHEYRIDGGAWVALDPDRIVEGLTAETEYDFEVRGVNVNYDGPASNLATVTTLYPVDAWGDPLGIPAPGGFGYSVVPEAAFGMFADTERMTTAGGAFFKTYQPIGGGRSRINDDFLRAYTGGIIDLTQAPYNITDPTNDAGTTGTDYTTEYFAALDAMGNNQCLLLPPFKFKINGFKQYTAHTNAGIVGRADMSSGIVNVSRRDQCHLVFQPQKHTVRDFTVSTPNVQERVSGTLDKCRTFYVYEGTNGNLFYNVQVNGGNAGILPYRCSNTHIFNSSVVDAWADSMHYEGSSTFDLVMQYNYCFRNIDPAKANAAWAATNYTDTVAGLAGTSTGQYFRMEGRNNFMRKLGGVMTLIGNYNRYNDEPTGRAAVSNGQRFIVRVITSSAKTGYVYERVDASSSTLIWTGENFGNAWAAQNVLSNGDYCVVTDTALYENMAGGVARALPIGDDDYAVIGGNQINRSWTLDNYSENSVWASGCSVEGTIDGYCDRNTVKYSGIAGVRNSSPSAYSIDDSNNTPFRFNVLTGVGVRQIGHGAMFLSADSGSVVNCPFVGNIVYDTREIYGLRMEAPGSATVNTASAIGNKFFNSTGRLTNPVNIVVNSTPARITVTTNTGNQHNP